MEKETNKKTAEKTVEKKAVAKGKVKKDGALQKASRFFKDLRGEVRKVVWPSKKQIRNNTVVVLCFMGVVGIFIWGLDFLLNLLVSLVFGG